MTSRTSALLALLSLLTLNGWAQQPAPVASQPDLQSVLAHRIVDPAQVLKEWPDYLEPRVPLMPELTSAKEWTRYADRLRQDILKRVVLRGEAARWAKQRLKVEWLDTLAGGPGYRIRKVRYEAVPGLWIPALLYEPQATTGKLPAVLNVSGHDPNGKSAGYKQIHCINQAKRGMLALNIEWLGMGQLSAPGYNHSRMNQLDLCGTSGLAPYYFSLKRGLDVLLGLPQADAQRVAVTGYSGGGWQTIFISALDPRVTLANPVAGYSSYRTRVRHLKDLGDSEQTPCDLATLADYTHLTAMLAPRAGLLTYNASDNCCYEASYVLPRLLEAAQPVFALLGCPQRLRWHINVDPGTHNYEQDNREAFYQMVRDQFYAEDATFSIHEIPSAAEVKTAQELDVPLPAANANFNSLALALSANLPRAQKPPTDPAALRKWQARERSRLQEVVKAKPCSVSAASAVGREQKGDVSITQWQLRITNAWTLGATELTRGQPRGTALLVADTGRGGAAEPVARLLAAGQRVVVLDPFYFGEARPATHDYLWALTLAAVGERSLGLQASQVDAVARWLQAERPNETVTLCSAGPRSSVVVLVAAALEPSTVAGCELRGEFASLKAVVAENHTFNDMPELFCFGLLRDFDMEQFKALARTH